MKKITALFLSFLMVAMLLPLNVWAMELELVEHGDHTHEEIVLEETEDDEETLAEETNLDEVVPQEEFADSAESEEKWMTKVLDNGYCGGEGNGKNLEWSLQETGEIIIRGTGAMEDYEIYNRLCY